MWSREWIEGSSCLTTRLGSASHGDNRRRENVLGGRKGGKEGQREEEEEEVEEEQEAKGKTFNEQRNV